METVFKNEELQQFRVLLLADIRAMLNEGQQKPIKGEWLKGAEVKQVLKISAGSLQMLRIKGHVKPVKILGSWRYKASDINKLLDSNIKLKAHLT